MIARICVYRQDGPNRDQAAFGVRGEGVGKGQFSGAHEVCF
jgi:hypothetical protein